VEGINGDITAAVFIAGDEGDAVEIYRMTGTGTVACCCQGHTSTFGIITCVQVLVLIRQLCITCVQVLVLIRQLCLLDETGQGHKISVVATDSMLFVCRFGAVLLQTPALTHSESSTRTCTCNVADMTLRRSNLQQIQRGCRMQPNDKGGSLWFACTLKS
jgi:hypothetical protein